MDQKIIDSSIERLRTSSRILIALPAHITVDTASVGWALYTFLSKAGKEVTLASSGTIPVELSYIAPTFNLKPSLSVAETLVVTVNTKRTALGEISYETSEETARIFLTPKTGIFEDSDVTLERKKEKYDCIITLGSASLEELGSLYENATDMFFGTPLINIDILGTNEYYGALNLVEVTAVSLAEVVYELMQNFSGDDVSESIATALLTGIMSKTHSFQDVRTSPKAFTLAAQLMDLGGNHQQIVQHLYKTKPLALLQLWGRALARLKIPEVPGMLISSLSIGDLEKTAFAESGLAEEAVLSEMMENISGHKMVALLVEQSKGVKAYIALHPQIRAEDLFSELETTGSITHSFNFYKLLEITWGAEAIQTVEQKLIDAFKRLTA